MFFAGLSRTGGTARTELLVIGSGALTVDMCFHVIAFANMSETISIKWTIIRSNE